MSKPTITVIVPVYKAMATLDRCVESVVSQDVAGGLACILVDDGSPDDSGKLCDAWAVRDPRVTVIHQDDLGVSGARNSGLGVYRVCCLGRCPAPWGFAGGPGRPERRTEFFRLLALHHR